MKQSTTALKTMGIKARVYNQVRKQLYKKQLKEITIDQKIVFFDNLFKANQEAHAELNSYKDKRKERARIQSARVARGYVAKKKTSLEQYESTKKEVA